MDELDLSVFQADSEIVTQFQRDYPRKRGTSSKALHPKRDLPQPGDGHYLKGPVPLDWLSAANRCGRRGVHVGLLVWYAAGYQRANPITFYPSILKELQVSPRTAKRVLVRMVEIGLVEAVFHRGKSPVVTVLDLPVQSEST